MERIRRNKLDLNNQHIILKRIINTLLITLVYIMLTEIPLPYMHLHPLVKLMENPNIQSFQLLTVLAGGNITQGSILLIGLMPNITVQLLIQILQLGVSKKLKKLSESANGSRHLSKIIKVSTFPLAFIQSVFTVMMLQKLTNNSLFGIKGVPEALVIISLSLIISTSTMIAVWLSDLNTLYGLGNGINYLISCSIIVSMVETTKLQPKFIKHWSHLLGNKLWLYIAIAFLIFIIYNAICIWYQSSTFSLKLQFAQLASSIDHSGNMPLSLNIANVMPVIFAGILMNVLYMLNIWHNRELQALVSFKTWGSIGLYTLILIIFTYVFTFVQYYPHKLNENLDRMNAVIEGVDPTLQTVRYLRNSLLLLASINVVFFIIMVTIPMIICKLTGMPETMVLSVSSVLIVITTESDIRRQISGLRAKQLNKDLATA